MLQGGYCDWRIVICEVPQPYGKESKKEEGFSLVRCEQGCDNGRMHIC